MGKLLNNFAYKTTISLWLLLASGLLALTIAMLTVSWAALKAARANPAEVLRKD
jgi:putative ABC transport system permease protein